MVASQGVKDAKPEWFNPYGEILYRQEAKAIVDTKSAQIFVKLREDGLIPGWVFNCVDFKLINAASM